LRRTHRFSPAEIVGIRIESFRQAIDLGSQCPAPTTTDDAQYSLPYGVAAALVFDRVGAEEVDAAAIRDPRVVRLLDAIVLAEDADFSQRFPAERWARLRITLADGRTVTSEPARARGNPENPLSDAELIAKYRALAVPVLGSARAARIEAIIDALPTDAVALPSLLDALLDAASPNAPGQPAE
jgi:2-methylcitrate dehydratase PrpD